MNLIDDGFRAWWKKYSALALFLIAALNGAWAASPDMQALVGPSGLSIANGVLAVLGFVGRFIRQTESL